MGFISITCGLLQCWGSLSVLYERKVHVLVDLVLKGTIVVLLYRN